MRKSLALILSVFIAGCGQPADSPAPFEDTQPNIVMVLVDDLVNDPYELRNVIVDPQFVNVLSDMDMELNRLLEETS